MLSIIKHRTLILSLMLLIGVTSNTSAAPGDFDATFGKGGVLGLTEASGKRIPVPTLDYPGLGSTLTFGLDGSVYVGGGFTDFRNGHVVRSFVARVLRNGQLDPSFSTGGVLLRSGFRAGTATTDTIAVLESGRLIVSDMFYTYCGIVCPPLPSSGRIVQSLAQIGVPFARVDDGLLMRTSQGQESTSATGVFKDGGIVALNRFDGVGNGLFTVTALRSNGERDTGFEQNSNRAIACPVGSSPWNIITGVDKQDRLVIVVSGHGGGAPSSITTCITRLSRDGLRDRSFGQDGTVTIDDPRTRFYLPKGVAFSADGGIRVALLSDWGQPVKAGQIRLTATGLLDGRFSDGSIVIFSTPLVSIHAIRALPNGNTVMMGFTGSPEYSAAWVSAVARTSSALPDPRFGSARDGVTPLVHPQITSRFLASTIAVSEENDSVFVLNSSGTQLVKLEGTPIPTPAPRYEGLWWRSPAGSEAGWGVNLSHQGDILFATWFTYDLDDSGMWLVMPKGERTSDGKFTGSLYRTTGSPFNQPTFNPALTKTVEVGSATFDFSDANNGLFTYRVNGITQSKPITRQEFAALPVCVPKTIPAVLANYQGLWWNAPENSEAGWGINITHQSDTLFATWFTYDAAGKGMWLVMSNGERTAAATPTYTGTLYRARGPAFNANPWLASAVALSPVGTATLSFADANTAQFYSIVDGFSQKRQLVRQIFASPPSDCH